MAIKKRWKRRPRPQRRPRGDRTLPGHPVGEPRAVQREPGLGAPSPATPAWHPAGARLKVICRIRQPAFPDGDRGVVRGGLRLGRLWRGERRTSLVRLPVAVLLPGLTFFALGRPIAGLLCLGLQASLLGWLPAALWAARTTRRTEQKQRLLAGRLRPQ